MHEYESTSIADIRDELREKGVTDDETLSQTKKPLVELLLKLREEDLAEQEADTVLGDAEEDSDTSLNNEEEIPIPEVQAKYGSDQWVDFVFRQFTEKEMDGENPKCIGCRRVVQQFIGDIIHAGIANYTPPSDKNYATGTVVFEVQLRITNEDHPQCGFTIYLSDIADVNKFNTDPPYHKHPCATAATRAEARIWRKVLGITNITAEEKSEAANNDEDWVQDEIIDEGQVSVIDMMCGPQRCDIDVMDFVNCGKNKYATIYAVPRSVAARMIQKLNDIQQGICKKPSNVGRYDANWRS